MSYCQNLSNRGVVFEMTLVPHLCVEFLFFIAFAVRRPLLLSSSFLSHTTLTHTQHSLLHTTILQTHSIVTHFHTHNIVMHNSYTHTHTHTGLSHNIVTLTYKSLKHNIATNTHTHNSFTHTTLSHTHNSFKHNIVTHTHNSFTHSTSHTHTTLPHTTLPHTHATLSHTRHTQLFHKQLFHKQHCHTHTKHPHDLTFVWGGVPPFDNTSIWEAWGNVRFLSVWTWSFLVAELMGGDSSKISGAVEALWTHCGSSWLLSSNSLWTGTWRIQGQVKLFP